MSNPRIELLYTYLVAWYVMHCPSLMTVAYTDFKPFFAEVRALDLAACLYLLYLEGHPERLELSVGSMPSRYSGYIM